MRRWFLLVCLLTTAFGAAKNKAPPGGLPAKLVGTIEKIDEAYKAGDIEKVWRLVAPGLSNQKEEVKAAFDAALAAKNIPPTGELLVAARLKVLSENRTQALPAPSVRERILLLVALPAQVEGPLERFRDHPLLKEDQPPPENMAAFDVKFREMQQLLGKLQMAALCARYGADLAEKLPPTAQKKLTDEEQAAVAASTGDLATQVEAAARDLSELELETRLQRLKYGIEQLKEQRLTKEKFIAAASTRRDARALQAALAPPAPPVAGATGGAGKGSNKKSTAAGSASAASASAPTFRRAALTDPSLADEVAHLSEEAKSLAGELGEKSERFALGLEAWLRGRYGWGPEVGGMAKSSAALKHEALLEQVFMPEELPGALATGDQRRQSPTHSDRRHHYIWAWEDRGLATTTATGPAQHIFGTDNYSKYDGVFNNFYAHGTGGTILTTQDSYRTVSVPPQDPRLVYRIVGFVEYIQALQHLEKFVEEASVAEFEAAEEVIRAQDAFRIEINLSRKLEQASTLSEKSDNPHDDYSRHGLEWMLALARVEVGAMLAGFTSHANPFLCLAPTVHRQDRVKSAPFGRDAFAELLQDGLRTHYWSIVREKVIENDFKNGIPENHLLTYSRRALVGRQLVRAVLEYSGGGNKGENLPAAQRKELQAWDQTFLKLQRIMLYCLTYKVGQEKTTKSDFVTYFALHTRSMTTERDQTPGAIRQMLQTVDPTLVGCPCK